MPSQRNRTLLTTRLMGLVTPGWMDVEDFMELAIPLVPPGKAQRAYAQHAARVEANYAKRVAEGRATLARKPAPSEAEQIRIGARAIVNGVLGGMSDSKLVEVEVGENRLHRRIRLSNERQYAHHCCLHGGTCRGTGEEDAPEPADKDDPGDPLLALVERVLDSRREREVPPPTIREVFPGSIERMLRECG